MKSSGLPVLTLGPATIISLGGWLEAAEMKVKMSKMLAIPKIIQIQLCVLLVLLVIAIRALPHIAFEFGSLIPNKERWLITSL